eukprot:325837-Prymnesium_polylepis.2
MVNATVPPPRMFVCKHKHSPQTSFPSTGHMINALSHIRRTILGSPSPTPRPRPTPPWLETPRASRSARGAFDRDGTEARRARPTHFSPVQAAELVR